MTAQEKAKELFDKFDEAIATGNQLLQNRGARKCALIAVDEIIEEIRDFGDDNFRQERMIYFGKVKQEIENL